MIVGMNHFTVIAEDRQKTLDFYVGLLGLKEGWRPDLGFHGAWLYGAGSRRRCCTSTSTGKPPAQRAGVIDHMAFTASDLKAVKARFDAARRQVRPAPAGRLGHLAAVQLRPERRQGRARLRPGREPLKAQGLARRVGFGLFAFARPTLLHDSGSLLPAAHLLLPQRSRERRELLRPPQRQGGLRPLQDAGQEGEPLRAGQDPGQQVGLPGPLRRRPGRRGLSRRAPGTPTSTRPTSTRSSTRT